MFRRVMPLAEPLPRRSFVITLAASAIAAAFSAASSRRAQAAEPTSLPADHPLVGRIWDALERRFTTPGEVIERLVRTDFRLLGEVHDNPAHHRIQAELLEGIAAAGIAPVVAFEQMDRDHDAALQQRLASGNANAENVAEAVRFDRKGWNWGFYRPLVAIALSRRLPIRAANLSRAGAGEVARKGFAAVDSGRLAAWKLDDAWNAERNRALLEDIREGHCGALPEKILPNMAAAQRARDATLAEAMLAAGADGAVLIAGNGHVRRDLAVPLYLAAAAPARSCCAVGILEVDAGVTDPEAYLRSAVGEAPIYDIVFFTAREKRPDPCAAFRRKP